MTLSFSTLRTPTHQPQASGPSETHDRRRPLSLPSRVFETVILGALCLSALPSRATATTGPEATVRPTPNAVTHLEVELKMGSRFEVTAVHSSDTNARRATAAAWAEIDRIEALISSWRDDSETSRLNRAAGQGPQVVSIELFQLIRRGLKVAELTDGAFDPTFAGAGRLWDFKADTPRLPDPEQVRQALGAVGWRHVRLDEATPSVELPLEGMRIGFGGIGKGYAANRAVARMKELGASGGVVNAGGDLLAFGTKADGSAWTVAIADPFHRDTVFAELALSEQAVVTSGDYESFLEIDGRRYAHILDPRTGYPVETLRSVTIVCPDAELADALATGVFVLGPEAGLALINKLRGVEAMLVDARGALYFSEHLQSLFQEDAP